VADQVVAFSSEGWMWPDMNGDVEVASLSAAVGSIALTAKHQLGVRVDSWWDFDGDASVSLNDSDAMAFVTGFLDYCPSASAFSARFYAREVHEACVLHMLNLPRAATLWTLLGGCT
jgi:hypothetical protein